LPQDTFTILDADASQLCAIQAAVRGAHLIIQGPPGTGKSQTIANIIAECIAAGRTVLFVSEKAAAIEVVHRRLKSRHLDAFCLMLHSHRANKREIITELGEQLESVSAPPTDPDEILTLERLQSERLALDAYADALHRVHEPLGKSLFWAHGELAQLHHVPLLAAPLPAVASLTIGDLEHRIRLVEALADHASVLTEGTAHPWSGIQVRSFGLAERHQLRELIWTVHSSIQRLRQAGENLAHDLRLPAPKTSVDVRDLAFIANCVPQREALRASWFDRQRVDAAARLVSDASSHAARRWTIERRLRAVYEPAFFDIEPRSAIASYKQNVLVRLFSSSHRALKAQVRGATKDGQRPADPEVMAAFRDAQQRRQELDWFEINRTATVELLGLDAVAAAQRDENA
jgi:hypothetical protein